MSKKAVTTDRLRYKLFSCSEEFEAWQDKAAPISIHQIQPIVTGLDLSHEDKKKGVVTSGGTTRVNVFVLYSLADV